MNKSEMTEFIDFQADGKTIESNDLHIWFEGASNWQVELGFLNYLFTQVLERKKREQLDCTNYIKCLNNLDEHMWFRIHALDRQFIQYMINCLRQKSIYTLEEEIIYLHDRMCEYIY